MSIINNPITRFNLQIKNQKIIQDPEKSMSQDNCQEPICKENPLGFIRKNLQGIKQVQSHQCPLDRQQLGVYSWSLMHTFAIYYPQLPNEQQKKSMNGWLQGFKNMYPCRHCRGHFQRDYQKDPPALDNRKDLTLWVCRQHNYVNKILGKSQYPCNYQDLLKRWKTGCDFDDF